MKTTISKMMIFVVLFLKLGKPLLAIILKTITVVAKTMKGAGAVKLGLGVASFGAYSILIDWKFAVCILLLIGIHESGHVWAMRRMGMRTRGFYFIPLLGGAAVPEEDFPSAWAEGYVALMGPLWGLGVTMTTYLLYFATGKQVFEVAACWMAFVNLLNLIPVLPLDGGRALRSMSAVVGGIKSIIILLSFSLVGIVYCALQGYWLFVYFGVLGIFEVWGSKSEKYFALSYARNNEDFKKQLDQLVANIGKVLGMSGEININEWQKAVKRYAENSEFQEQIRNLKKLRERFLKWERRRLGLYNLARKKELGKWRLPSREQCRDSTRGGLYYSDKTDTKNKKAIERNLGRDVLEALNTEYNEIFSAAEELIPALRDNLEKVFKESGIVSRILFYGKVYAWISVPELRKMEVSAMLVEDSHFWGDFNYSDNEVDQKSAGYLMIFMIEDKVMDIFIKQYRKLHAADTVPVTWKQSMVVAAGFVWLVIVLFSIMTLTGGHAAASGAVDFFKNF